jgi:cysteine desulfuration protein SufE
MSIETKESEIIEEFAMFDDWQERFSYVIDHGKTLPEIKEERKGEETIVHGCQNKVYIDSEFDGNCVHYFADSEAQIPRGLLSLLLRVLNDEKPEDIVRSPLQFIDKSGIKDNLSMQRSNGLEAMIKRMKMEAMKYVKA